jgi:phenylacetic acid degradation operon negative regulatory protein
MSENVTPGPKGLVLDLLSTLRSGSMPVRALVAAAGLFGIDENRLRVALTRLLADGLVERDQRGAYRLQSVRGVSSLVVGWRRIEHRTARWDGRWLAVLDGDGARSDGSARSAKRVDDRALRLLGFERLQRGIALRPANLAEPPAATRAHLIDLGLRAAFGVAVLGELDEATDSRARALWDTETLRREYARSIARLETSRQRLPRLPEARAMVESFRLGGSVIRQIVLDPLLPPPLVPAGELAGLVRAMRAYDAAGRACWKSFWERHGIDFSHAPVDLSARESVSITRGVAVDHAYGGTA